MKAQRSSSDKRATHTARDVDAEGVTETTDLLSSSIWTVWVVQVHVFLLGQLRTRWPCFLHSKHWPVFQYSSRSLSLVALQITADISMVLSSWEERRGWEGCIQFPGPRQFWLLDPGLLPPGWCQTHPEVCLCPCPWVWLLLKVPYSEWSDFVFK